MRKIQRLKVSDLIDFMSIVATAYPAKELITHQAKTEYLERLQWEMEDPTVNFYGLFQDGQLLGGMRLSDFQMNLHSTTTLAGGVGLVAVSLTNKKQKVCKDLISFFLEHYRTKGAPIALLYAFRPDFYRKMGFGFGTKMNQYRIEPSQIPAGSSKEHIHFLDERHKADILHCYNRYQQKKHGFLKKTEFMVESLFRDLHNYIVGYIKDGHLLGYLVFNFRQLDKDNFTHNDLHIKELIYETRDAFQELMAFLNSQKDQFNRVVFNTQDEAFHYIFQDSRNGSNKLVPHLSHVTNVSALGIMYKIIDLEQVFKTLHAHNFGHQTCQLKINVRDSFASPIDKSVIVHFENGRALCVENGDYQVEITMDISDFSSMLTGAVTFKSLYFYGLAHLSDVSYLDVLDTLFFAKEKPECNTTV